MLVKPAANAISDIGIAVSSTSPFARCTRRAIKRTSESGLPEASYGELRNALTEAGWRAG
jgi:hypothetical protein